MRIPAVFVVVSALASACSEEPVPTRTYKFHAIAGVSMGAIGSGFLAGEGKNHERLDAVGMMGGPVDSAMFFEGFERMQVAGFCPLDRLEAQLAADPAKLDDPAALDCTKPNAARLYEHSQNFNHWRYTSNGGDFDRDSYLDIFFDLSLALGNPFYANPDSALFPVKELTRENFTSALCDHPLVIEKLYNKEYNPEGKYHAITFCDGEEPIYYCDDAAKTPFDPCLGQSPDDFCAALGAHKKEAGKRASENSALFYARKGKYETCWKHMSPVAIGLAVDLNGNGRRDYHEPVILNGHERFQDVGKDGCGNAREDGKGGCTAAGAQGDPNGDDFTPENPFGTEFNGLREEGEPYEDAGLDGVSGTSDLGEGNGKYDETPHRAHWLDTDFRQNYQKWSAAERAALDVYTDGGIRDVFNLGLSADFVSGAIGKLSPGDSKRYVSFFDLPDGTGTNWGQGYYDPLTADYATIGRNMFLRYGHANATPSELAEGEGDHVGTAQQMTWRFGTFVKWVSERWNLPLGTSQRAGGEGRREERTYFSTVLGAPRNYSIALPPGYDANPEERYPVLFLGHGYGMDSGDMSALNLVIDGFTSSGDVRKTIFVYPSGRCCYVKPDGAKDCRETDENGQDLRDRPGYVRECHRGNFYVNRQGFTPNDKTRYGDAIFELMDVVDKEFRVLAPKTVELTDSAQ